MIEIIIFCLIGSLIGFFSGLIPSLHQNLLIPIFIPLFLHNEILAISFLVSLAISQNFGNAISSFYLSSPPEDLSLSTLPSQRLAKEGLLLEALKIYLISAIIIVPITIIFVLFFNYYISKVFVALKDYIGLILLIAVYTIFFFEKEKIKSLLIFILAGFLGLISFNLLDFNKAVLALFSGFFALSQAILNLFQKENFLKNQIEDVEIKISKKELFFGILLALFLGMISGLLPSLGTSQIILIFQPILNDRMFLLLNSAVSFSNEIFSASSTYTIGNPRSGLSVYLEQAFGKPTYEIFILILSIFSLSTFFGCLLFIFFYKRLFKFFQKINFKILNILIILIIITIVFIFSSYIGIIILLTSTSLSLFAIFLNVKRSYLMGSLIFSTILIYTNFYSKFLLLLGI
ncbi:MAG: tripartite tricarboxylate transporter permease [Candidatus Aenigmatarchaeota archaeon]